MVLSLCPIWKPGKQIMVNNRQAKMGIRRDQYKVFSHPLCLFIAFSARVALIVQIQTDFLFIYCTSKKVQRFWQVLFYLNWTLKIFLKLWPYTISFSPIIPFFLSKKTPLKKKKKKRKTGRERNGLHPDRERRNTQTRVLESSNNNTVRQHGSVV